MTDELVLSREGRSITFGERTYDPGGRLQVYQVSLAANGMRAALSAWHCNWAPSPAQYFGKLADQWRGWDGVETWNDPEGEWSMSATADALGHVRLDVEIAPEPGLWPWRAMLSVALDAGQLEELRRGSAAFFGELDR